MTQRLRPHQLAALRALLVHGPLPASRLARFVGHSPREAAEFARRLAARGYVTLAGGSWGHSPTVSLARAAPRLAAALALLAAPASAQEDAPHRPCGRLATLAAELAGRFHETPVDRGLAAGGSLLVVFASPGGDTWTAAQVSPAGTACVIATGKAWQGNGEAPGGDVPS